MAKQAENVPELAELLDESMNARLAKTKEQSGFRGKAYRGLDVYLLCKKKVSLLAGT